MRGRRDEIRQILRQLEARSSSAALTGHSYALHENIRLIESLWSVNSYLNWFANHLPQLQPDPLLELNELLPEWDEPIHRKLLQVERDRWPAFIRPLVNRLASEITSADRPMAVMDLGAGSMEIERQVLLRLLSSGTKPVTFVAIDESHTAQQQARANLAPLSDRVDLLDCSLDRALDLAHAPADRHRVIFCSASALALSACPDQGIDLLFHSFLRHHLTAAEQIALDVTASRIATSVVEYDGYSSRAHLIPLSMLTWPDPAFLAASLFSHVRFPSKRALKAKHNGALKFFQNGCYLVGK